MVNFAVAYNNGGTDRTGSVIIAGERSTITQAGRPRATTRLIRFGR
jgi:hypothetical protein